MPPAPSRTRFAIVASLLAASVVFLFAFVARAAPPSVPAPAAAPAPEDPWVRLVVLHTNDVHGGIRPRSAALAGLEGQGVAGDVGGVAALASFVARERKAAEAAGAHVLLLDGGDVWRGTPEGDLTRGDLPVEALGRLRYDAVAVGNHEFDYGVANLARLVAAAPFPWISANVVEEATGKPPAWLKTSVVLDEGGVRVGVVGMSPPDTPKMVANDGTKGLAFLPEAAAAKAAAAALEGKADVIVFLTHLGPDRDKNVAAAVPRVPLIVGGHSHTRLYKPVPNVNGGATWIVQAGTGCVLAGRVRMRVHRATKEVVLEDYALTTLDPKAVGSDAETEAFLARRLEAIPELKALAAPIGRLTAELSNKGVGTSSPAGNLVADAMRAATGADVAITNRGGLRVALPKGPVTGWDLYVLFPFENTIVEESLTGAELSAVLASSLHGISALEVSGLSARYRVEGKGASAVATISAADVSGSPLDPARAYRVAVNSFLAGGGDGYGGLKRRDAKDTGTLVRDAIRAWFVAHREVAPDPALRIRPE